MSYIANGSSWATQGKLKYWNGELTGVGCSVPKCDGKAVSHQLHRATQIGLAVCDARH